MNRTKFKDADLAKAIQRSTCWREVCIALGCCLNGSMQIWLKRRAVKAGFSFQHFPGKHRKGRVPTNRKSAGETLVRIPYTSATTKATYLRRALVEIGRAEECSVCKLPPVWQGKPLRIEIDHIDGDKWNNEPNNLRFICPNCHAQAPTSTSSRCAEATKWNQRRKLTADEKKERIRQYELSRKRPCAECGKPVSGERCRRCDGFNRGIKTQRIEWPLDEELIRLITERSPYAVARDLGVSDNAIRHRLARRGYKVTRNGVTRHAVVANLVDAPA